MQIQNDVNSYQGTEYHSSHQHHITKCLYDEEPSKQTGAAAALRNNAAASGTAAEEASGDTFYGHESGVSRQAGSGKGRPGFIREFWDSLGEEEKGTGSIFSARDGEGKNSETHTGKISAVSAAIRQIVPSFVIAKVGNAREKIKAGIGTALKRFGKREDTFGALSNPGSFFEGKRRGKEGLSEKTERGTRRANQEIISAAFSDSHLMDSYSKTGQYCRLNENLIYQKNKEDKKEEFADTAQKRGKE
ncbi:MAG: hypothetical protein NC400_00995 [Clostridium sp.]|nr:hypothetical protein [Clostridium sp.]